MSQSIGKSSAFQCPHCGGKFALPAEVKTSRVRCPHCNQAIALPPTAGSRAELAPPPPSPSPPTLPSLAPLPPAPAAMAESSEAAAESSAESSAAELEAERSALMERARQLLPPKFTARAHNLPATAGSAPAVLIPTAEGGFTPVATDLVRISHRGREVTLRRSRPTLLRSMISAFVVLLCAIVLVAAFFWLLRSNSN